MALADYVRLIDEIKGDVCQVALGGRGDPNLHKDFEEILRYTRTNGVVPNYTTSGLGLTEGQVRISKEYCGAVAVSWHNADYTRRAVEMLAGHGVITNIHYVLSNSSIERAKELLGGVAGVNSIVFLLHKPIGAGSLSEVLRADDPRVAEFFGDVDGALGRGMSIGFDSCCVPGIINLAQTVDARSIEACEAGRFSMYVSADMRAFPCSFGQHLGGIDLRKSSVADAWNSDLFDGVGERLRGACPSCVDRADCLGGCWVAPGITLCERMERV